MQKMTTHLAKKTGLPPGTAIFVGEQKAEQVKITVIDYDKDRIDTQTVNDQVIESSETFRDMMSGIHDIYLSSISNKMNEIMQFLTIVGTIFIPLTFIAGIYGMNFQVMPELAWRWGYFAVLGLMAAVGVGLLAYFRRRHWL